MSRWTSFVPASIAGPFAAQSARATAGGPTACPTGAQSPVLDTRRRIAESAEPFEAGEGSLERGWSRASDRCAAIGDRSIWPCRTVDASTGVSGDRVAAPVRRTGTRRPRCPPAVSGCARIQAGASTGRSPAWGRSVACRPPRGVAHRLRRGRREMGTVVRPRSSTREAGRGGYRNRHDGPRCPGRRGRPCCGQRFASPRTQPTGRRPSQRARSCAVRRRRRSRSEAMITCQALAC